jgi:hypothetical protein
MFIKKIEMFTDGRQMPSDGNTNVAHLTWRVRWAKKGENDKQWIHVGKISHPDFGYPVLALWFSNSYTLLNYLAFQSLLTSSIDWKGNTLRLYCTSKFTDNYTMYMENSLKYSTLLYERKTRIPVGEIKKWQENVKPFPFYINLQTKKTRGSQEPVIAHLVFNLTSKVDRKWGRYT